MYARTHFARDSTGIVISLELASIKYLLGGDDKNHDSGTQTRRIAGEPAQAISQRSDEERRVEHLSPQAMVRQQKRGTSETTGQSHPQSSPKTGQGTGQKAITNKPVLINPEQTRLHVSVALGNLKHGQ
jgi:hypothetical protein